MSRHSVSSFFGKEEPSVAYVTWDQLLALIGVILSAMLLIQNWTKKK